MCWDTRQPWPEDAGGFLAARKGGGVALVILSSPATNSPPSLLEGGRSFCLQLPLPPLEASMASKGPIQMGRGALKGPGLEGKAGLGRMGAWPLSSEPGSQPQPSSSPPGAQPGAPPLGLRFVYLSIR